MILRHLPFLDVFRDVSRGNTKTLQREFLEEGDIPVVDQGQSLVAGFVNDRSRICKAKPPVIVFGDHTRAIKYVDFEFAMGADGTKVLAPKIESDPKYLYYALRAIVLPAAGYSRHYKFLKETQIPLPPLEEQKRIAGILDAADALRAKRRESLAQLDTLLQSTFLDMFGECDRPPISIGDPTFGAASNFVPLSKVARLATGHTPDRKKLEYWGGEFPWISLTDIRELDGTIAAQTLQNVTEPGISNSSSVLLPAGTVCFSRTASVGFVAVMGREMATSQDFVNWVCGDRLDPIYLMWALRQSRPYLLSKGSGSTHKTIYYRHAEQFQVFLPALDLQHRFATIFESIEQQKDTQRAHLDELDSLFASLQSRAFAGDL